MKFLVVDDSPTMRRIVINALKTNGYADIEQAGDGVEAVEVLNRTEIDVLITDWNMPNMSGLELTKKVRGTPKYKNLPILMVTTRGLKEDIIDALKAKVNNYLVKPFTPVALIDKLKTIL